MAPKLITMLTRNDETVQNALEIFEQCADLPCECWGFKDVGLPVERMKKLVNRMKEAGKTTFLEVVSLTERECMAGARTAVDCRFDYLVGTVFYNSVFEYVKKNPIRYMPFCGKVSGHPSIVEGSIADAIADGLKMEQIGVHGFDLLAYRYTGDAERLASEFIASTRLPVVVAGSIGSFERLDAVMRLNPWAFTIGSAFFESRFVPGGSFRQQIEQVLAYLER